MSSALFSAWYFYGRILFQRGDLNQAAGLFEQAERVQPDDTRARNLGIGGLAHIGEKERALECLERAGLQGMLIWGWAENDSDLATLHGDPRFVELMARLKAMTPPAG